MIIDFHTHIFPETIAAKTIASLEQRAHIAALTNGTLEDLKRSMYESNITTSVILPVVTNPSQFTSINEYAAMITGKDGIISFGGIHPDSYNYIEELDKIHSLGLLGIKLHPDYQSTFIDDERYLRIMEYALNLDLIIVIHAGIDVGLPTPIHCSPQRSKKAIDIVLSKTTNPAPKLVLAHTGGFGLWEEVLTYLVKTPVYFDLSYSLGMIPTQTLLKIIHEHGSEHILFATDSPWGGQKETLEKFLELPLDKNVQDNILYKNACNLLNLKEN